jgi:hypothetical protein
MEDWPIGRIRLHHVDERHQAETVSGASPRSESKCLPRIPTFKLVLDLLRHHFRVPLAGINVVRVGEHYIESAGS